MGRSVLRCRLAIRCCEPADKVPTTERDGSRGVHVGHAHLGNHQRGDDHNGLLAKRKIAMPSETHEEDENPYRSPQSLKSASLQLSLRPSPSFLIWFVVVAGVVAMLNSPRDGGILAMYPTTAGFPWVFATWHLRSGRLIEFDGQALAFDIAVGFAVSVSVALACSWSRRKNPTRQS